MLRGFTLGVALALALALGSSAFAQTSKTRADLETDINNTITSGIPSNITGATLRGNLLNMAESSATQLDSNVLNGPLQTITGSISQTETIAVAGGQQPSNSLGWYVAHRSGIQTSTTGGNPGQIASNMAVEIQDFDTVGATGSGAVSLGYDYGLEVYKNFGVGNGVRTAINAVLINTSPTAGNTTSGGSYNSFYTGIFANVFADSNDGGLGPSSYKGSFFAIGGIVEALAPATYIDSAIGAELDVKVDAGASLDKKVGLQILSGTGGPPFDAVHGATRDAGIMIGATTSNDVGYNFGIVFGVPGAGWPIPATGTIIGTYASVNSSVALNGVDFSGVTFQAGGCAFKSTSFCVGGSGVLAIAGSRITSNFPNFIINDTNQTVTTGGLVRLVGLSGTYVYQINTAVAGDFSTSISGYSVSSSGVFGVPNLAGSGSRPVCATALGVLEAGSLSSGLTTCP